MKARIKRKIQKRPFLYNVGQVFKACDWLTSIQRGNMVWRRYRSDGTRGDSPGCGSILIAFGEDNAEILRTCDIAGKYVRIN